MINQYLLRVCLQVMYMTGWAPHDSQQKPAARGSATVSFEELATVLQQREETEEPRIP